MRSRRQMENAMLGRPSWMSYAPQGVKGLDNDDDDDDDDYRDRLSKILTSKTVRQETFSNSLLLDKMRFRISFNFL
jgi:hypothetical protein